MARPYAEVIGDPIAHSKSPRLHRFWLSKAGIDADYVATHVRAEELADYVASRRADPDWRGCNVTVPHKQAIKALLDRLTPLADEIGAVNLVVPGSDLVGANTDVEGITGSLPAFADGELRQLCLIGSGGAALAALGAARLLGVQRVVLNVRDQAKGRDLLADWGFDGRVGSIDDRENIVGSQLVVNATTLGMTGHAAMPDALLEHVLSHPDDRAVIFDMVYEPLETRLLAAARQRGLRAVDGLSMLIGQAEASFGAFFGVRPPREHDAELRAHLTS